MSLRVIFITGGSYTAPKLAGPYKGAGVGPSPARARWRR